MRLQTQWSDIVCWEAEYELALKFRYCEPFAKNHVGRERRPNVAILECSICRWEGGEVGREGEKGGRVVRWQGRKGRKGGRVVTWEGGSFLVLF